MRSLVQELAITYAHRIFWLALMMLLLTPLSGSAQQRTDDIRCNYTKRTACFPHGCTPIEIADAFLLVPPLTDLPMANAPRLPKDSQVAIRRCDSKGCTPIAIITSPSGIFLNVWTDGGGYMLKIALQDESLMGIRKGDFMEATTTLLTTLVSYGSCPF